MRSAGHLTLKDSPDFHKDLRGVKSKIQQTSLNHTDCIGDQRMILRIPRLRPRPFHTSAACSYAKGPAPPNVTPSTSTAAPFPSVARPAGNDPTYVHPPSSVKAGATLRGVQLLKDKPEVVALADDFYPDWLWQLFDDPKSVEERMSAKRLTDKKKDIYRAQLKEEETNKRLTESMKSRVVKPGEKRTEEEKKAVRREAQNEAWLVNREKEYEVSQFEMPPERNAKFHRQINREKIKQANYLRARGM